MSAADKATARPWKWEEGTAYITRHWNGADHPVADIGMPLPWHENSLCASREAGANAALIVRAVNSFALAEKMAEQAITFVQSVCTQQDDDDRWLAEAHKLNDVIHAFREASSGVKAVNHG